MDDSEWRVRRVPFGRDECPWFIYGFEATTDDGEYDYFAYKDGTVEP